MTPAGFASPCPRCGASQTAGARFCQQCGTRLGSDETLELPLSRHRAGALPSLHQAHRRPLGAHPAPFLAGVSCGALLLAVLLFALTSWVAGMIGLALWLASVALFLAAIRREPDAPLAGPTLAAETRVRSLARVLTVTVRVWSRAGVELLRLASRRHRLRRELAQQLRPLGEAVHREEETRVEQIRAQAAQLEQALRESERAASAVIDSARDELERERAAADATTVIPTAIRGSYRQPPARSRT